MYRGNVRLNGLSCPYLTRKKRCRASHRKCIALNGITKNNQWKEEIIACLHHNWHHNRTSFLEVLKRIIEQIERVDKEGKEAQQQRSWLKALKLLKEYKDVEELRKSNLFTLFPPLIKHYFRSI